MLACIPNDTQVDRANPKQCMDWLLQLPKPALHLVLQQLDSCSLACTAVTCSTLSHACSNTMSKVAVSCSTPATLEDFSNWLQRHNSSLSSLQQCSIVSKTEDKPSLRSLPSLSQLRQLHLSGLEVQLGPAGGFPGVLQNCTGLTALHLKGCVVQDVSAAPAAIAALPRLQSLSLAEDSQHRDLLPDLQHLSQLTYLSWETYFKYDCTPEDAARLSQLSALVNLQHLDLTNLPKVGIPAGLPSQLVKLTFLHVDYRNHMCKTLAEQLQHLSSLTGLQQLSIKSFTLKSSDLTGIQQLPQLTSLKVTGQLFTFKPSGTFNWASLTALQSLALRHCRVDPKALRGLTQLQALSLDSVRGDIYSDSPSRVLSAVAQLPQLTELIITTGHTRPPWIALVDD